MPTTSEIKDKALQIISQYFGRDTAKLYEEYFKDKNSDFIERSLTELLTDIVGTSMAIKIIQDNIYA